MAKGMGLGSMLGEEKPRDYERLSNEQAFVAALLCTQGSGSLGFGNVRLFQ
jgi:hypothetical protein